MKLLENMPHLEPLLICVIVVLLMWKTKFRSSKETHPNMEKPVTQSMRLTCKNCHRTGYLKDFSNCSQVDCKLTMAKNNKPPAILAPVSISQPRPQPRHSPHCMCTRCLDADVESLEGALNKFQSTAAAAPVPVQVPIRVMYSEQAVNSECDDDKGAVYLDVPTVLCCSIYPKGKKSK